MAPDWASAVTMVEAAEAAGVPFMIHENWRWQPWYRQVQACIRRGDLGALIGYGLRTRCRDGVGEHVYPGQEYFLGLSRMLIDELLVHYLDTARFLFGDLSAVYAQAERRNPRMAGEDRALLLVTHENGVQGWIDGHRFLNTEPDGPVMGDAFFEGEEGCLRILPTGDVWLGSKLIWKNEVTAGYRGDSVRTTQAHFIAWLRRESDCESSGRSYLRTFAAVEACYRSIRERRQVSLSEMYAMKAAAPVLH
jgi:D-apiose dehydrogenase